MEITQILGIVAFLAIVGALALVLRGTSQLIATTRADEAFRRAAGDAVARAEGILTTVLQATDDARYRTAALAEVASVGTTASAGIAVLVTETRGLAAPADRIVERDAIVGDLAAAQAALDRLGVSGGASAVGASGTADAAAAVYVADAAWDEAPARIRVKRAYLDLAHAAASLTEHGRTATTERPRPNRLRMELASRRATSRSTARADGTGEPATGPRTERR